MGNRKVNWLEECARFITASIPQATGAAPYLAERLSALMLQRLPEDIANELLEILPEHQPSALENCAASEADTSIGLSDFVERAGQALGCGQASMIPKGPDTARKLTETFLWAFANPLPAELKEKLARSLPSELKQRMNFSSAASDESKVA